MRANVTTKERDPGTQHAGGSQSDTALHRVPLTGAPKYARISRVPAQDLYASPVTRDSEQDQRKTAGPLNASGIRQKSSQPGRFSGTQVHQRQHVTFRDSPLEQGGKGYSVKSAEFRRKSDTSVMQDKESQNKEIRRNSDAAVLTMQQGNTSVLAHRQRSVVHVSGNSTSVSTCARASTSVVTKQPVSGSMMQNPLCNPDWPTLPESDYENCADTTLVLTDDGFVDVFATSKQAYGYANLAEGVKSLVKLLHVPFQCCKRKVGLCCN
ncbi:hypothetical protein DPMN_187061 [Dreissena polymorpha]|uniref:Uncharacterized protein n=1 Tax=Dreissena polymorpha TaxID=45954 RepID=A0A9D4DNB6_DREPO|nr:hypothetical protein DPMN_187061 [Dreissena polymorpha]